MKTFSYTLKGRRESNEDQHVTITNIKGENKKMNNINFFSVFDGHGGNLVSKDVTDTSLTYTLTPTLVIDDKFTLTNVTIVSSNEIAA